MARAFPASQPKPAFRPCARPHARLPRPPSTPHQALSFAHQKAQARSDALDAQLRTARVQLERAGRETAATRRELAEQSARSVAISATSQRAVAQLDALCDEAALRATRLDRDEVQSKLTLAAATAAAAAAAPLAPALDMPSFAPHAEEQRTLCTELRHVADLLRPGPRVRVADERCRAPRRDVWIEARTHAAHAHANSELELSPELALAKLAGAPALRAAVYDGANGPPPRPSAVLVSACVPRMCQARSSDDGVESRPRTANEHAQLGASASPHRAKSDARTAARERSPPVRHLAPSSAPLPAVVSRPPHAGVSQPTRAVTAMSAARSKGRWGHAL